MAGLGPKAALYDFDRDGQGLGIDPDGDDGRAGVDGDGERGIHTQRSTQHALREHRVFAADRRSHLEPPAVAAGRTDPSHGVHGR